MAEPNFPAGGNFAAQTRPQPSVQAIPNSTPTLPLAPTLPDFNPSGGDNIAGYVGCGSLGSSDKPFG